MREIIFSYILPMFIVFTGVYFSFKSEILKDQSNNKVKPYSFARTQLMWWTLIIISCFTIFYGKTGIIYHMITSTLILLGISLGTTTAGRIIDNNEINNNILRHQNENHRKGFLNNILSDNNGISIHRFQAFAFNLIFGLMFLVEFVDTQTFIDFEEFELGLMGISSAAYVGLKLNENSVSNKKVFNSEDDLSDIDEAYSLEESFKNVVG